MTDLESTAARGSDAAAVPGPVPTVADRRITDLSASVGSVVWLALVAGALGGAVPLSPVALYVAFATLVLVPLGIGLLGSAHGPAGVAGGTRAPPAATPYRIAVVGQFPAALAVAAALAAPQGTLGATALVVPWLAVTGAIALVGLRRLAVRGIGPLPELAVDAACLYVPVAAVFLLFHAAGIGLRFAPIIVLLTGVHFHYAGFVLPLVVGLVGRRVATDDGGFAPTVAGRGAAAVTLVVVAGIGLIAVGIAFSPLLEAAAVVGFTAAVLGFAVLVLRAVVPSVPRLPGALLALAALSLCWTMALALAFAYSSLPGTVPVVSIPEMIRWHGSVNAFGFALPALLAVRSLEGGAADAT